MDHASSQSNGVDAVMPIAVVGISGRYPGDAADPEKLWELISNARSAMTEVPADRFNIDAFWHPHNERSGTINCRGGHYMKRDVDAFDAPFFSITPNEAKAMDPQQRMALECAYEAMENAGIPIDNLVGSDTSCFVGSFSKDYSEMVAVDPEDMPLYFGVGTGTAILSNRISWYFDLRGPSISIDTACSSALVALHLGCQSIRTGESKASIVGGVNFMLVPGVMTNMSALHFLSPDSKCHSFDEKANGYARGEGASFVVLKPLDLALRDHDMIRGVIRNTSCNQDGNTPGITVPSAESQEAMIRKCYADAGLSLADTQYAEAHGTGTQAGDPQEASALSASLGKARPGGDPLLIGSIKTNIGHLEGASGLAQVTKAVFALEKAEIPPNIWYEKPNPRIPMEDWNLKVVDKLMPWPSSGPRRISINSFGYGGTNAHCIIDDAYHYLRARGLQGNHNTVDSSGGSSPASSVDSGLGTEPTTALLPSIQTNLASLHDEDYFQYSAHPPPPKLFIWSSNEQSGVERTARLYDEYLTSKADRTKGKTEEILLTKLARTLSYRRTIFPWRSFAVSSSLSELQEALKSPLVKPKRAGKAPKLGFIFTGQGAQWYAMGRELCAYRIFQQSLQDATVYLHSIGAPWSLLLEFFCDEKSSRINSPGLSQPICTALQVALVDLLRHWGVKPTAVAGHSSGEIAAAYAKGSISREGAWCLSYHRGRLSEMIPVLTPNIKGAMLATGLGAAAVQKYVERVTEGYVTIACKNSPSSTTLSGDESAILQIEKLLKEDGHFARRLMVETAYHSSHMSSIADMYLQSIAQVETIPAEDQSVKMFSSVTGRLVKTSELNASYWISNMVNQVNFVDAVESLCHYSESKARRARKPYVDILVELGPHSALQGPVKQILKTQDAKFAEIVSISMLQRGQNACVTALNAVGNLFQFGYPANIATANNEAATAGNDGFLVDIPPYAWNRNNKYWAESQASRNYRFRKHPRTDLLGSIVTQANTIEPSFRNILRLTEVPWMEDHKVQGTIIYPAAGMLVMAIEAAVRQADPTREVEGYELGDVIIGKAIVIPNDDSGTETMLSLRPWRLGSRDLSSVWDEFRLFSRQGEVWELNCTGLLRVKYKSLRNEIFVDEDEEIKKHFRRQFDDIAAACTKPVDAEEHYQHIATLGHHFSGPFKSIVKISKGHFKSRCEIQIPDTKSMMPYQYEFPHVIHPSTLDCIIQTGITGATALDDTLKVALIPIFVERLFVSAQVPVESGSILHCCSTIQNEGFENAQGSFIVYDNQWKKPLVTFDGIKSSALRKDDFSGAQAANIRKIAAYFHWQEDIEKLDRKHLGEMCSDSLQDVEGVERGLVGELEHAAFIYMRRVLATCGPAEAFGFAPHMRKFYQFMQKTVSQVMEDSTYHNTMVNWIDAGKEYEAELLHRVARSSTDGAAMCKHGEHLVPILRGEILAIEVLMEDNLLNNFYQFGIGNPQIYAQLSRYIDLLAHRNPDMKILEIGAGTGGATLPVLTALGGQDGNSPRFSNYTFTDISTGFFEKAQEKFKTWVPFMNFAKLDIEADPTEQGFKEGGFDLIVAANVLHATLSMDKTLSYVKKLLKPDGKLILSEITNPLLRFHMIVGSFEGWWAGEKDGREWGPTMTEEAWHNALLRNGFSGIDLALHDIADPTEHAYSLLVSTASVPLHDTPPESVLLVEPDTPTDDLCKFLGSFVEALKERGTHVQTVKLQDTATLDVSKLSCIFMLDCDANNPALTEIDDKDWEALKNIIMSASNTTWLTRGATVESEYPSSALMTGIARCVRAENPNIALLTLDLDPGQPMGTTKNVENVVAVYLSGVNATNKRRPDWEYAIRDDKVFIQRILLEKGMNDLITRFSALPKPETAPFKQPGRPLELTIGTPGRLDTFAFDNDMSCEAALLKDEVEIEVKGVGLNFKDVMIAMGQLQERTLGLDCSGVVSRVGDAVTRLKVGDRVMTWTFGSFRNFARSPQSMCFAIPSDMSFGTAASLPVIYCTAYYALFEIARLKKGETILIHGAAGGVGQAAIILAQHIGAEVFATVSSKTKKELIMEQYKVSEDHIFNSRNDSFVNGCKRMTANRGVNVVLNSLAGEALQNSWHCIAFGGRFVEMGKADIESNTGLEMAPFAMNTSYHAIDLAALLRHDLSTSSNVFQEVMTLLEQGIAKPIEPINSMPFSSIEKAFRLMQTGKHIGKIVLEANDDDLVPVIPAKVKPISFSPDVTYILSGGTGGLGRSIAQWLVRHGARNIVFLSRSGSKKAEAKTTLETLTDSGARVAAYSCDIADAADVAKALKQCAQEFPPIRGVIQAAMVLQDAIYSNMTHEQYMAAIRPKVQGSWNLHELLPKDLDFFVLLSSSAGIAGSRGQSNYAAGNAFQDALSHHRKSKGLAAGAIDLGVVLDVGYVAESQSQEVKDNVKKWSFVALGENEVHALIQAAITGESIHGHKIPAQIITGLGTGGMANFAGLKIPWWFDDSKFAHVRDVDTHQVSLETEEETLQLQTLLSQATSFDNAAEIVSSALVHKLSKSLMVGAEDIDVSRPLSRYGVDSLLAVEVRSYLFTELQADISVFELLSNVPISQLVKQIVGKSKCVPAAFHAET